MTFQDYARFHDFPGLEYVTFKFQFFQALYKPWTIVKSNSQNTKYTSFTPSYFYLNGVYFTVTLC